MNLSRVKSRLAASRLAKAQPTNRSPKESATFPADVDSVASQSKAIQSASKHHIPVAFVPLKEFTKTNGQSKDQVWREIHRGKRMAKEKNGQIYVEVKSGEQIVIPDPTSPNNPDSSREGVIRGASAYHEAQERRVYKSSSAIQLGADAFDAFSQDLKEHISGLFKHHFTTQTHRLDREILGIQQEVRIELNRQKEFLSDQVSSIRKNLNAAFLKNLTHELGEQKKVLNSVVKRLQKDLSTELERQCSQELKHQQKLMLSEMGKVGRDLAHDFFKRFQSTLEQQKELLSGEIDDGHQNLANRLAGVLQRGLAEQSDASKKLVQNVGTQAGAYMRQMEGLSEQIEALSGRWENTQTTKDRELHKQWRLMGEKLQAYEAQISESLVRFADMLTSAQTEHQRQTTALDEKTTSVHESLAALAPISNHMEQMRSAFNKKIIESTKHLKSEITHEVQSESQKQQQSIRQYVTDAHESLADLLVEIEKKQVSYDFSEESGKLHKAITEDIQSQFVSEFKRQRVQMSNEFSKAQEEMAVTLEGYQNQLQAIMKAYEKLRSDHGSSFHQTELSKLKGQISKLRHQLKEQNTEMRQKEQQLEDLEVLNKALLERESSYIRRSSGLTR